MDIEVIQNTPPWDWPEETGEALIGILNNREAKASDRLLAAELAGDPVVLDDEIALTLLAIVESGNESTEMRVQAAISLGPGLEMSDMMDFDLYDENQLSEDIFLKIKQTLHHLYDTEDLPKELRRRILEASIRASEKWHREAVRTAYDTGDEEWRLTAVFCMSYLRGFDKEVMEAFDSENSYIQYHAICAAGNHELEQAWPHIAALLTDKGTEKSLVLAAIDASVAIQPEKMHGVVGPLLSSEDEDISEAAFEAMEMAEGLLGMDDFDIDDDVDF
jgi:hypothetical protein